MHDEGLQVNVQCTSARLLLNLVEVIYARRGDVRSAEAHRTMLCKIQDSFMSKLSALRRVLPRLLLPCARRSQSFCLLSARMAVNC